MSLETEILRRYVALEEKVNILKDSFPTQTAFIKDESRLKAAMCARRSGKSYGTGLYLLDVARENPNVSLLYVALTRSSAKRIMFKDVFKDINRKFDLGCKFNEVELTVTLPNGSIIYCLGMDQSAKEQDKALGQKFKLAIIDECASFRNDLRQIVYSTILPALADLDGTLAMIGTASNLARGLFFDVTTGKEPGWSLHKWSFNDNPYTKAAVNKQIKKLKEENPAIVETPMFRQMYLNEWVVDENRLVYKYDEQRNLVQALPDKKWDYVLGVDLGYNDDTAFVLCAWNQYHDKLYIVDVFKKPKMDITDTANKIKFFQKHYGLTKIIMDGANKQAVEEIRKRHQIPIETADKTGKSDFIEILNADLIMGKIQLLESKTYSLVDEWQTLIWDDKKDKRVENASCPNHASDAFLYAWRYCYTYLNMKEEQDINIYSPDVVDNFWDEEAEKIKNKKEQAFWEMEF